MAAKQGDKSRINVAEILRRQILLGEKSIGEKLNQEDIAQELNVSRIPVREAFKTLAGDGLVRIEPNRGAWVSSYHEEDVRDIFEMRKLLEPMALSLAFDKITKKDLGIGEDLLDQMNDQDSVLETAEKNQAFHQTLYRPCGRKYLLATLAKLHTASHHMAFIGRGMKLRYNKSHQEHLDILEACKTSNLKAALTLTNAHIGAAMQSTLESLKIS